jgi:hypothetical protein
MPLKPDDLAAAMLTALPLAWKEVKGFDFPDGSGQDDQRVLFIAIARGLLTYLKNNPNEILNTIDLTVPPGGRITYTVNSVDFKTNLT